MTTYTLQAYICRALFIELPLFSVDVRLTDEELRRLQGDIIANPACGNLIPHGAGLRKVRVAISGLGKRGGARVIYYMRQDDRCYLVYAYAKNVQGDLTPKQLKQLAALAKEELKGL